MSWDDDDGKGVSRDDDDGWGGGGGDWDADDVDMEPYGVAPDPVRRVEDELKSMSLGRRPYEDMMHGEERPAQRARPEGLSRGAVDTHNDEFRVRESTDLAMLRGRTNVRIPAVLIGSAAARLHKDLDTLTIEGPPGLLGNGQVFPVVFPVDMAPVNFRKLGVHGSQVAFSPENVQKHVTARIREVEYVGEDIDNVASRSDRVAAEERSAMTATSLLTSLAGFPDIEKVAIRPFRCLETGAGLARLLVNDLKHGLSLKGGRGGNVKPNVNSIKTLVLDRVDCQAFNGLAAGVDPDTYTLRLPSLSHLELHDILSSDVNERDIDIVDEKGADAYMRVTEQHAKPLMLDALSGAPQIESLTVTFSDRAGEFDDAIARASIENLAKAMPSLARLATLRIDLPRAENGLEHPFRLSALPETLTKLDLTGRDYRIHGGSASRPMPRLATLRLSGVHVDRAALTGLFANAPFLARFELHNAVLADADALASVAWPKELTHVVLNRVTCPGGTWSVPSAFPASVAHIEVLSPEATWTETATFNAIASLRLRDIRAIDGRLQLGLVARRRIGKVSIDGKDVYGQTTVSYA